MTSMRKKKSKKDYSKISLEEAINKWLVSAEGQQFVANKGRIEKQVEALMALWDEQIKQRTPEGAGIVNVS